ncbi:MAG: hypothetical protein WCT16_01035 [Candidatus Buchananbacteria bacterium]
MWQQSNNRFNRLIILILLPVVFFMAAAFWYFPVFFKGSTAQPAEAENFILARNLVRTGFYGMEDSRNIVLAPSLVSQHAQPSTQGNKFTTWSYAALFKYIGLPDFNVLIIIAVIIQALALVLFAAVVFYLFGWEAAIIFSLVYILLPFNSQMVQTIGTYEFAMLYFAIFSVLFFLGRKTKGKYIFLPLAGIFLSLSCLAREVMFLFPPVFFCWLIFQPQQQPVAASKILSSLQSVRSWFKTTATNLKKNVTKINLINAGLVFVPFFVMLAVFWLPAIVGLRGTNDYFRVFVANKTQTGNWSEFNFYGHLFPDPYTFYFDQKTVLDKFNSDIASRGILERIDLIKVGANIGIRPINLMERMIVGSNNLLAHLSRFVALEYIGGSLFFILMLLGIKELSRRDKNLTVLFASWLVFSILISSYVVLASRDHLMDWGWAIALFISFGLTGLVKIISDRYVANKFSRLAGWLAIFLLIYGLIQANHVYWGRGYDDNVNLKIVYLAEQVRSRTEAIKPEETVVVGNRALHPLLNYLTGVSAVYFSPETVGRLLQEQKLQSAFEAYNVKYVIGYDSELAQQISSSSQAINIADWPRAGVVEAKASPGKMWFLNLIK